MARRKIPTIEDLRDRFRKIRSIVTDDTLFIAHALMFLSEAEHQRQKAAIRKKRPLTVWQKALKKGMREGKSTKQIAEEYQKAKQRREAGA